MPQVLIVGTSHVAGESIQKVKKALENQPDCIAVELDAGRYIAIKRGETSGKGLGITIGVMKFIQDRLGEMTGFVPGEEMIAATDAARKHNVPVFFIDQDILITLQKIKAVKWTEKTKLFTLLLRGGTQALFGKTKHIDLQKVPSQELIGEAMEVFRKELPTFAQILVDDRDAYMADRVRKLAQRYERIVVVVGAGHVEGMRKLL